MVKSTKKRAIIIGAGPAGITAGLELAKNGSFQVAVIEKEEVVGGLSKTIEYKGCRFDIGPHHYLTDVPRVMQIWKDLMGTEFEFHRRFTRIFYKKHFFSYPLQPLNVLRGLSIFECIRSIFSYIKIRLFPIKNVKTFQDWVTNKFGHRLFSIFFKTYTEKLWGIECSKISSDWASQRIKGFSLSQAIFYAFFGRWFTKNKPRTLSDEFFYPTYGAGTLWEKMCGHMLAHSDTQLFVSHEIVGVEHDGKNIISVLAREVEKEGQKRAEVQKLCRFRGDHFLSTMSLRSLILSMDPLPPQEVLDAAKRLCYRGLLTVNLIADKKNVNPDHWLYVHEKSLKVVRVDNMNNFSLKLSDDAEHHTGLILEYFGFVEDDFWQLPDQDLINLAGQELEKMGLIKQEAVLGGTVLRTPDAYPIYDEHYRQSLDMVLAYLSQFSNLELMGRNGQHRYNNMDVAMISAFDAVENVLKKHSPRKISERSTTKKTKKEAPLQTL